MAVESSTIERAVDAKTRLTRRLARKLLILPKPVQHNFVWAACRDKIYAFAQILALPGQLPDNLVAYLITESILKPHPLSYHQPPESHPDGMLIKGVAIYIDNQNLKVVRSMLACGKFSEKTHGSNERSSKELTTLPSSASNILWRRQRILN